MNRNFSATLLNEKIQEIFIGPFLRMMPVSDVFRLQKEAEMAIIRWIAHSREGSRRGPDRYIIKMNHADYRVSRARFSLLSVKLAAHIREFMQCEGIIPASPSISVKFESCAFPEKGEISVNADCSGDAAGKSPAPVAGWFIYPEGNSVAGTFIERPGEYIAGRDAGSAFVFDSAYISGRHAVIELTARGELTLRDLNSRNGTSINGLPVHSGVPITLNRGDRIRFGKMAGKTLIVR